jgi:CRISPR type III-B/RAMP module-associated protein Cmr5
MSTTREEVLRMLVDCFEFLSKNLSKEVAKSLRARARDMYTDLVSKGLSYVLILCASRGDLSVVESGLRGSSCQDLLNLVKDLKSEDAGYALYGAILLMSMKRMGLLDGTKLSEVIKNTLDNPMLDSIAYNLMDWVKRLAEAYLEAEG